MENLGAIRLTICEHLVLCYQLTTIGTHAGKSDKSKSYSCPNTKTPSLIPKSHLILLQSDRTVKRASVTPQCKSASN